MVRVTPLQWCSNLELANCGKEIFVLGRNLGYEGTLFEFCTDLMLIDLDGDWYSCTGHHKITPGDGWKPIAFARIRVPDNLKEFCEECEKEQEERRREEEQEERRKEKEDGKREE